MPSSVSDGDALSMAAELKSWGDRWNKWAGPAGDESRYKRTAACAYAGAEALHREASVPTAVDELALSKNETEQVTALYDEAHEKLTMAESEIARLNDLLQKSEHTAAEVIAAAEKALGNLHKAAMDLRCATAIPSVTSAVVWHNAHQAVLSELVVAENALAAIAKWKEANNA